jgi:predicted amidohydrolase YtcJ
MAHARPRVEAMAVHDGRIAAVGADVEVRPWIGPRTRVIELRGRTVTPGFGDAHVHVVASGLERLRCDLTDLRVLEQKRPFLPDERIPFDTALEAFTLGSAWVKRLEDDIGSIEIGKTADLAVLDRDLFDSGAGEIGDTTVVATFIDGVAVFERPELEA